MLLYKFIWSIYTCTNEPEHTHTNTNQCSTSVFNRFGCHKRNEFWIKKEPSQSHTHTEREIECACVDIMRQRPQCTFNNPIISFLLCFSFSRSLFVSVRARVCVSVHCIVWIVDWALDHRWTDEYHKSSSRIFIEILHLFRIEKILNGICVSVSKHTKLYILSSSLSLSPFLCAYVVCLVAGQ